MIIISGKEKADYIALLIEKFIKGLNFKPRLDIFLVGNNLASNIYVDNKVKRGQKVGVEVIINRFGEDISQSDLENELTKSSSNKNINGIILQMPIPKHLDYSRLINCIDPNKDVDGLHHFNAGQLYSYNRRFLLPCTAFGCLLLIKNFFHENFGSDNLSGKKALVVGRSNIVGKPAAQLLLNENCTVTVAHSKTKDLDFEISNADILVSAIGRFNVIKPELVSKQAVVIDVGINSVDEKICGDIDFNSLNCLAATPVPGGVGPMTVIMLLFNVLQASIVDRGLLSIESNFEIKLK